MKINYQLSPFTPDKETLYLFIFNEMTQIRHEFARYCIITPLSIEEMEDSLDMIIDIFNIDNVEFRSMRFRESEELSVFAGDSKAYFALVSILTKNERAKFITELIDAFMDSAKGTDMEKYYGTFYIHNVDNFLSETDYLYMEKHLKYDIQLIIIESLYEEE